MGPKKLRTRKTDAKRRLTIAWLYSTGIWTQQELADLFGISKGRVNQIINDTYGEMESVAHEFRPKIAVVEP